MVTSHLGEFSAFSSCLVHSRLEGEEVSNPETAMNETDINLKNSLISLAKGPGRGQYNERENV